MDEELVRNEYEMTEKDMSGCTCSTVPNVPFGPGPSCVDKIDYREGA